MRLWREQAIPVCGERSGYAANRGSRLDRLCGRLSPLPRLGEGGLLLTRQQYISHSGLQAGAGTRRSAQARVTPLPRSLQCIHALATLGHPVQRAGTQVRRLPEAPHPMIFKDRPRLNAIYIVAGLITRRYPGAPFRMLLRQLPSTTKESLSLAPWSSMATIWYSPARVNAGVIAAPAG